MQIHLDTDIGGDTDDLCALALLLASPDVEVVGITTVADRNGGRIGFVRHALELAGRGDIPSASGAYEFLGGEPHRPGLNDERYWPGLKPASAGPPGEAIDLLEHNARSGATVVAIGPYTNLAILETMRPGAFSNAEIVVMGGWHRLPPEGFPRWNHQRDYNVQADRVAARIVFERLRPLVVPLDVTVQTWIRRRHLPTLQAGGPLARLISWQSQLYGRDHDYHSLAASSPALPGDLLNFQHDTLAAAVALEWDCVRIEQLPLEVDERDGSLLLVSGERTMRVVTAVDGEAFAERWLAAVASL